MHGSTDRLIDMWIKMERWISRWTYTDNEFIDGQNTNNSCKQKLRYRCISYAFQAKRNI
jgi:hypothetical protein